MYKKLLGIVLGVGSMAPMAAWALGLGEISVFSKPGEPFRAQIPLRSVNPDQMADIQVRLASPNAFESMGMQRSAGLDQLHFRIRSGATPVVIVSSSQPLPEGTLRFLLELDWGGGRLVKEYATSIDGMSRQPLITALPSAAPVEQLPSAGLPPVPATPVPQSSVMNIVPRGNRPHVGAPTAAQSWARVPVYGPITAKDTLYTIALRMRRDSRLSVGQVMAALYRHNPKAFNGNPNNLKPGAILSAPPRNEVASISGPETAAILHGRPHAEKPEGSRQGHAEHAARHEEKPSHARLGTMAGAAKPAARTGTHSGAVKAKETASAPVENKAAESKPSLYLSAPQQNKAGASKAAEAGDTGLPDQLKALQEEDAAVKKQNELLMQRVDGLSRQVQTQKQLILQLQSQGAKAMASSQPQPSLLENPLILLLIGSNALMILLVLWLLMRVRKTSAELAASNALARKANEQDEIQRIRSARKQKAAAPEELGDAPGFAPAIAAASAAAAVAAAAESEAVQLPRRSDPADDVDVLEQADLYLNYGRIQQAQEVLEDALFVQGGRKEIYVKLLDLYVQQSKLDDYLDLAERMRGRFGKDNPAWRTVAGQGAMLFPDNPLFQDEPPISPRSEERIPEIEFGQHPLQAPAAPAQSGDASLMDFDLGAQAGAEYAFDAHADTQAQPQTTESDPFAMDFSLDQEEPAVRDDVFAELDREFKALDEAPAMDVQVEAEPVHDNVVSIDFPSAEQDFGHAGDEISYAALESDQEDNVQPAESYVDWDTLGTKLDLAKAYVDMGDGESARELLEEIAREGNSQMRAEAEQLLASIA